MASAGRSLLYGLLVLVLALLCGGALAAPPKRYLSVSLDQVVASKARAQCYDPSSFSGETSGNKFAIHPSCSTAEQAGRNRDIANHDRARLSTIRQRSYPSAMPPMAMPPIPPFIFPPSPTPGSAPAKGMPPMLPVIAFPPMFFPPNPAPSEGMPPVPAVAFPPIYFPPAPAPAEGPSVTIPDVPGTSGYNITEFIVIVGFGTPPQPSALLFDTGSDLSWVQCQPCAAGHCYQQRDPLFDPTKSSTYEVEMLTFSSSRTFSSFPFGCGTTNLGDFGSVDGLLGLGRGQLSLASQTASSYDGTFSYCLPSHNMSRPGFLSIGAAPDTGKVQYTAMIKKPEYPSFYFVELASINIGGYVLPVPPSVFTSKGTLLDSGTTLTYIPSKAYALLRDRFKFTMKGNKPAPPFEELDTCYDFSGQSAIVIPGVSFNFSDGAVFDLDFYGIMMFPDEVAQPAYGCLAFAAGDDDSFSIIGNTQQRSAEVIYDVAAEKIGFVPFSC
ncbi:aspartyl protease family protein At5g10770-like [Triticum dicoccoides]|uniref:aspartyl protease family protein At5g10770-like n=1 Tax=Triticum dicoccoides TaxID=85692 RepID=UPI001891E073|nr:aspartyl protease family protein At5g10770-like [Triticum dicoccoides]